MKTDSEQILELGELAGRYRLDALIGEGGFGYVFKAFDFRDPYGGRDVAIKVLKFDHTASEATTAEEGSGVSAHISRFRQEVEIYNALNNPHTLKIHDFVSHQSGSIQLLCIVMEFLDGVELEDMLALGPLSEPETIQILRQVLVSLQEAHSKGIIHRDIKPQNIMVCSEEPLEIKVLDYGIAKILDDTKDFQNKDHTQNIASIPLTRSLLTPEHANTLALGYENAQKKKMTQWGPYTDMWALGMLAMHCLQGFNTFSEESDFEDVYYRVRDEEFRLIPFFNGYVGETMKYHPIEFFIADIVNKMLVKNIDPSKGPTRYMSCEEVLADLDALEASEAYQAFLERGNYEKIPLVEEATLRNVGAYLPTVRTDTKEIEERIRAEDSKTRPLPTEDLQPTNKLTPNQLNAVFADDARKTTEIPPDVVRRIRAKRAQLVEDQTMPVQDEDIISIVDPQDFVLTKPLDLRGRMVVALAQKKQKASRQTASESRVLPATRAPETITSQPIPVEVKPPEMIKPKWPMIVGVVLLLVVGGVGLKMMFSQGNTPIQMPVKVATQNTPSSSGEKIEAQSKLLAQHVDLSAKGLVLEVSKTAQTISRLSLQGYKQSREKKWKACQTTFEQLATIFPSAAVYTDLAICVEQQGQYVLAKQYYERALNASIEPYDPNTPKGQAFILTTKQAIDAIEKKLLAAKKTHKKQKKMLAKTTQPKEKAKTVKLGKKVKPPKKKVVKTPVDEDVPIIELDRE